MGGGGNVKLYFYKMKRMKKKWQDIKLPKNERDIFVYPHFGNGI